MATKKKTTEQPAELTEQQKMAAKKKEVPEQAEVVQDQKKEEALKLMEFVKGEITSLLKSTGREGVEDLTSVMEEKGFFTAPASSGGGRHSAEEGGLAQHSLNVFKTAAKLAYVLLGPIERNTKEIKDSLTIVCLLHDLGKCGDYGKALYVPNILKSGKQSDAKPWERNKDLLPTPHAFRSVEIANRWIDLTEDEAFAIRYHDGLYDRETGAMAVIPGHETKLLMLLHWADMWSSRVIEGEGEDDE